MASLKKPSSCTNCSSILLHREKNPERWVCDDCLTIVISREPKSDSTKCRECGAKRGTKPFKARKNICQECFNKYMTQWRNDNPEHWREYRDREDVKKRLQTNVRKAIQKSPKAFIRYLSGTITKRRKSKAGQKQVYEGKLNPACLEVCIDFDYLWGLWEAQDGRCALSELPMMHEFNNLCSISVDRVDSDLGYTRGNVQLVCKWVNLAKGSHGNEEFLGLIDNVRAVRI